MGWLSIRQPTSSIKQMAIMTVRQLLTIARDIYAAAAVDPDLDAAERNVASSAVPVVDAVIGDLNAQNIIPQLGRRNAAITNLHDQAMSPFFGILRNHQDFSAGRLYNGVDAVNACLDLIRDQSPSDDLTL